MDLTPRNVEGEAFDFSCYIYIKNNSEEDLLLSGAGINGRYGVWPDEQPVNTINAGATGKLWLKDPSVFGGSEGWAEYEVPVSEKEETIRLEFACPQSPLSDNYIRARSSNPKRLQVDVKPYSSSGHPLTGYVEVWTVPDGKLIEHGNSLSHSNHLVPAPVAKSDVRAEYEIGFKAPAKVFESKPVHETIAIAAFIQSKIRTPRGLTYGNLNSEQWEYFRGIVWNDDPSCYLFDDKADNNHSFSTGLLWLKDFWSGKPDCMIQRSHYGDLQFLHAMGTQAGELPAVTQAKALQWIGVMYKLACGNQGVQAQDKLSDHFPGYFSNGTTPSASQTLQDMILADTPQYRLKNIQSRALGICIHVVQDSYSLSHTHRRLMNPEDRMGYDGNGHMQFRPGRYGIWGPVLVFHNYGGQDHKKHSWYDGTQSGSLPDPKYLDSFNSVLGARSAIDASVKLINAFQQKLSWDDVVEKTMKEEILAVDPDAVPSDGRIDRLDILPAEKARGGTASLHKLADLELALISTGESFWRQDTALRRRRSLVLSVVSVILAACVTGIWIGVPHLYKLLS